MSEHATPNRQGRLVHRGRATNPERPERNAQQPEQEHDAHNSGDDRTDVGREVVRHARQSTRQSGIGCEGHRGTDVQDPCKALFHVNSPPFPSVDDESLGGRKPTELGESFPIRMRIP